MSLTIFFNRLYSISKIALPRYSRVTYKKIEWMRIRWLIYCKLYVSRCDMEKSSLITFNAFVMQKTPARAKCQHGYCFRVSSYVCLFAYTKRFFGENCSCFRNNLPFYRPSSCCLWSNDFDDQQHFVLNSLWLIVCHWRAGIFVTNFAILAWQPWCAGAGLCHLDTPSLRLWCYAIKIGNFSQHKQIFKSESH